MPPADAVTGMPGASGAWHPFWNSSGQEGPDRGGRVNEQSRMVAGAMVGALVGAAAAYLFFTARGRELRNRFEPMVDDLRDEFVRFQRTFEKVGVMASEGMRVVNEFNAARSESPFRGGTTSH